jgi:hypothetical protein
MQLCASTLRTSSTSLALVSPRFFSATSTVSSLISNTRAYERTEGNSYCTGRAKKESGEEKAEASPTSAGPGQVNLGLGSSQTLLFCLVRRATSDDASIPSTFVCERRVDFLMFSMTLIQSNKVKKVIYPLI